MLEDLRRLVSEAGGAADLRRVAERYAMPSGRAWKDIPDDDIERLHRHTVGGEPLPSFMLSDDSAEGRKFNESIPF